MVKKKLEKQGEVPEIISEYKMRRASMRRSKKLKEERGRKRDLSVTGSSGRKKKGKHSFLTAGPNKTVPRKTPPMGRQARKSPSNTKIPGRMTKSDELRSTGMTSSGGDDYDDSLDSLQDLQDSLRRKRGTPGSLPDGMVFVGTVRTMDETTEDSDSDSSIMEEAPSDSSEWTDDEEPQANTDSEEDI